MVVDGVESRRSRVLKSRGGDSKRPESRPYLIVCQHLRPKYCANSQIP